MEAKITLKPVCRHFQFFFTSPRFLTQLCGLSAYRRITIHINFRIFDDVGIEWVKYFLTKHTLLKS